MLITKFRNCKTMLDVAKRVMSRPKSWNPDLVVLSKEDYISVLSDSLNNYPLTNKGNFLAALLLEVNDRKLLLTARCSKEELLKWYADAHPRKRILRMGHVTVQLALYRSK
jgi:hypothetical protein